MASSHIITGQFVRITQTPASVGQRIMARFIDQIVVFLYLLSVYILVEATIEKYNPHLSNSMKFLIVFLFILPGLFYSVICETFNRGQSLGKMVMNIRVVNADGTPPTLGSILMRWVLLIIDIHFLYIGIFFIMSTKKNRRIGDLAAGTMVVRVKDYRHNRITLDEFRYATADYTPVYTAARNLSNDQAEVIRKTLEAPAGYDYERITHLATKVQKFLAITPSPPITDNVEFLTTLLRDYQHYATELI